jgi:hypothetical protein
VVEPEPGPADPRALQFSVRELEHMEFDSDPLPDADESWADEVVVHPQAAARALPALHLSPRHHLRIGDDAAVWRTHNIDYYTFAREVRFWRLGTVP